MSKVSIINTNPANQPLYISGANVAINVSGSLNVSIVQSGNPQQANVWDTNSDSFSVNDTVLYTVGGMWGYSNDDKWRRLNAVPLSSGRNFTAVPVSGWGLLTSSMITGPSREIADVYWSADDAMGTDNECLQVGARTYGVNRSGQVWQRIDAVQIKTSGANVRNIEATSGIALLTASIILDEAGAVANVTAQPNHDVEPTTVGALNVLSKTYGYNRTDGVFTRIDAVRPVSGGLPNMQSGYALLTASLMIGASGLRPIVFKGVDDSLDANDQLLFTSSHLHGYQDKVSGWTRIRSNQSGALSTYLAPASDIVDVTTNNDVTGASGGEPLAGSTVCRGATHIQARSTNSGYIAIGGNNTGDYPSTNQGYRLQPGDNITLYISNWNIISVFAQVSGDSVSAISET